MTSATDRSSTARAVLEAADINRALTRIAHEILERNKGAGADPPAGHPHPRCTPRPPAGRAHRRGRGRTRTRRLARHHDVPRRPAPPPGPPLERTEVPEPGVDGKVVVLVDDVLFSGRTVRAALDALSDLGRPRPSSSPSWSTAATASCPIRADYVGKNLPTSVRERVRVLLEEHDGSRRGPPGQQPAGGPGGEAAPHLSGRPQLRRRAARPRHGDGDGRPQPSRDQEAPDPARPHRGQPVLRGLRPAPGSPSRRRPSGCPPTSSTSRPRAPACPRARASRTPR